MILTYASEALTVYDFRRATCDFSYTDCSMTQDVRDKHSSPLEEVWPPVYGLKPRKTVPFLAVQMVGAKSQGNKKIYIYGGTEGQKEFVRGVSVAIGADVTQTLDGGSCVTEECIWIHIDTYRWRPEEFSKVSNFCCYPLYQIYPSPNAGFPDIGRDESKDRQTVVHSLGSSKGIRCLTQPNKLGVVQAWCAIERLDSISPTLSAEDGMIVGMSLAKFPCSFFCTSRAGDEMVLRELVSGQAIGRGQ